MIKAGDMIECFPDSHNILRRVGIVEKIQGGTHFTAWMLCADPSGEFHSLAKAYFKIADGKFSVIAPMIADKPSHD